VPKFTTTHLDTCRAQLAETRAELEQATTQVGQLTSDLARSQAHLKAAVAARDELGVKLADLSAATSLPRRVKLPAERQSLTHKFTIHSAEGDEDGYVTVSFYPNGEVGEFFLRLAKQGSVASGFADQWAIASSILLQLGHPLEDLCRRLIGTSFEPSGRTNTPGIRMAKSPVDYVCRYLLRRFVMKLELTDDEQ